MHVSGAPFRVGWTKDHGVCADSYIYPGHPLSCGPQPVGDDDNHYIHAASLKIMGLFVYTVAVAL